MAEKKIRKCTKQALQALVNNKKKTLKRRLFDFTWEVFIIIIAVSITIWFHGWNAKRHEKELEKNFLIGIKSDLNDVKDKLNNMVYWSLPQVLDYYDSVWVQINERKINKAYVDSLSYNLMTTNLFVYNNSRFENFKSSGYLRLIKNDSLSMSITDLYTIWLPFQAEADDKIYGERRRDFITYIGSKARIDSSGRMIVSEILDNPEVKFQIYWQKGMLHERKWQKQNLIEQVNMVMNQIDDELKKRFGIESDGIIE